MKTLFLTREYPPHVYGGAGVHVEYLTRELAKRIVVEVRCFGDQDRRDGPLSVTGHQLSAGLLDGTPDLLRSPLDALSRCLSFAASPSEADVVHCHTWYSHLGGILHKQLYGLPLVISIHSLEPLRPWKREQLGRGYDLSAWVERTAIEMADAIIAVSQGTREDVLAHFRVDPSRIVVIPNGIDADEYRHDGGFDQLERHGVPRDLPYLLFVGRVTRQKGIVHLLRAVEGFPPDLGVVLCAGAPDTEEIAREVESLVADLQQRRSHVYWIREMVPKQAAIQLYSRAEVFCCPSIYEPFGIINLEAMACRTAVVASAVGGIKEVVVPEQTGLLVDCELEPAPPFDPRDPGAFSAGLAAAVCRLMDDDRLRHEMAEAGRRRVEEHFTWGAIARQVEELYRQLPPTHA